MRKELDRLFLLNYYQGMADELDEIFEMFLQETPVLVAEIKNAALLGQFDEAIEKLHKIIPSFTSIGLPALSIFVQDIETYLTQGKSREKASYLIESFENELNEYMPAIQDEYARLKQIASTRSQSA
jgi:HPt (histidine-containing phosphotransfer) domain-containing protein